jgi:hypothetical protein
MTPTPTPSFAAAVLALAALLASTCTTDIEIGPSAVATLGVAPSTAQVIVADTQRFTAVAQDSQGVSYVGVHTTWTSDNPAVATVSATGLVEGMAPGGATITATAGGLTATATVTVVTPAVITLSAGSATFAGTPNAPDPAAQTIDITNTGGAALTGLALGATVYGAGASGWLTAALDQTDAPATLTLAASVAGLGVGSYTATVPVTAPRTSNSPQDVTVTFTVAVGAPTQMIVQAGDNQSAIAGTAVSVAPAVLVRDAFLNPVPGVAVSFVVSSGGGNVTAGAPITDAGGIAAVGGWTLGGSAGPNTLTASAAGLADVVFSATGNPGNAFAMALAAGNAQTDTVGATLATAYQVRVTDINGNGVAGVTVGWAVPLGQGSITPSTMTNATGFASATRILGTIAGTHTATAAVGGLQGSPVNFSATANAGTAATIALNAGGNQIATAGQAVAVAPSVIVRDGFTNVKAGVNVTFAATAANGVVTGGAQATNGSGVATVGSWTLGAVRRPDTLTATAAGLTGSPVIVVARAAWGLTAHVQPQLFNGCAGCHTGLAPDLSTATVSYQVLLNGNGTMTSYVTPFDTTHSPAACYPASSGLLLCRLKSGTIPMPPGTPLSTSNPALYALVRDWILDGARP